MSRCAFSTVAAIVLTAIGAYGAQEPLSPIRQLSDEQKFLFQPQRSPSPPNPDSERSAALGLSGTQRLPFTHNPDSARLAALRKQHKPEGNWGGTNCPSAADMRDLVDQYLATPHPDFPGFGSTTPGLSTSWSSADCGTFTYAAGLRSVEEGKPLTPETRMTIASMTKPIIAAMTLMLNEAGLFGPRGLDTPVSRLLTRQQVAALTVGDDPANPRCPGTLPLVNRATRTLEWTAFTCPDLSKVTLRHLMLSNHGMYDMFNEVATPNFFSPAFEGAYFELLQYLGVPATPPPNSSDGFEILKAYGLKRNTSAVVGGNLYLRDLEVSLGNTGFQLLAVILEQRTGRSLDDLIRRLVVEPLRIDSIFVYVDPDKFRNLVANGYDVETGEPLIEQTGVYPLVSLNGHTGVNSRHLGLGIPANINLAGGAAGLVANQKSYRVFLDAFVNGGLLNTAAQRELKNSFILVPDFSDPTVVTFNGFGVTKQAVRGFPGFPDLDVYSHGGSLLNARCENGVIRRPDTDIAPIVGTFCKNSNGLTFPDTMGLLLDFIGMITNANPGGPH